MLDASVDMRQRVLALAAKSHVVVMPTGCVTVGLFASIAGISYHAAFNRLKRLSRKPSSGVRRVHRGVYYLPEVSV